MCSIRSRVPLWSMVCAPARGIAAQDRVLILQISSRMDAGHRSPVHQLHSCKLLSAAYSC